MNNTVKVPFKNRYRYSADSGLPLYWVWCLETFGPPNNSAYGCPANEHYWRIDKGHIMWFAKQEHATMFALRWA